MGELKTQENDSDVEAFLNTVPDVGRREDARTMLELMREVTGQPAKMWGSSMIGFDRYFYRYDSGREGSFFVTGFSPRKANLVVYIMPGYGSADHHLDKLGKHRIGKSCLYLLRLSDIDLDVLRTMLEESIELMRERYPTGDAALIAEAEAAQRKAARKPARAKKQGAKPSATRKKQAVRNKKTGKKQASAKKTTAKKPASTKKTTSKKRASANKKSAKKKSTNTKTHRNGSPPTSASTHSRKKRSTRKNPAKNGTSPVERTGHCISA